LSRSLREPGCVAKKKPHQSAKHADQAAFEYYGDIGSRRSFRLSLKLGLAQKPPKICRFKLLSS
jgi:hypothetical protein